MGKAFSHFVKRPVKNWNVENRAHRALKRQEVVPLVSPRHPSTIEKLDQFSREHPELLEEQRTKNAALDDMLKGLVVNPEKLSEIETRPLPQNRSKVIDPAFGYLEPVTIPQGRCSIRQALEFISAHNQDSGIHSVESIAHTHNMDNKAVADILKHFHMLWMQMPQDSKAQQFLTGDETGVAEPKPTGKLLQDSR